MEKILVFLVFGFLACSLQVQSQTRLDTNQTEVLLQSDPSAQLIDVRTPAERQR